MITAAETKAMRRALEIAGRGPARGINPRVGCVIINSNGTVISEGWHRGTGSAHAEVDALQKLGPGSTQGTTAVVTMEPCNHTGNTGPCAAALIDAGVARVVYAVADPGIESAGGAARLAAAGVVVEQGLLADEVEHAISDWLFLAQNGRPRVTLKWAASLDGRIAAADGTSRWITGEISRDDVHNRRATAEAIAVGTGTVLADDPALTARSADGMLNDVQPIPVVFGTRQVPSTAAIYHHPLKPMFFAGTELAADLKVLAARGIRSLFVEGGPTLASAFISAGLVDEFLIYLAPSLIGGPMLALGEIGVPTISAVRRLKISKVKQMGNDLLVIAHPAVGKAPAAK